MPVAGAVEGITDPTDWVSTRLPSLQRLDNSLRCQVCKEFLSAPLITECSHTFCSLCIRRCFTQEQKCPTCRVPGQEARLRRNAGVEECVEAFLAVRGEMLRVLKEVKEEEREKRDGSGEAGGGDGERSPKRRRRGLRRSKSGVSYVEIGIEDVDGMGDMDGMDVEKPTPKPVEVVESEPDDGLFPCPGCNIRMKVDRIPYHIEACLKAKEDGGPLPPPPTGPALQPSQPCTTHPSQPAPSNNQQFFSRPSRTTRSTNTPQPQPSIATRLPKPNYSLMNHKQLRDKLQEFGLPTTGTKAQIVARHSEWVNLYNANLDSLRPKPTRVLVQDLDLWEKTVGKDFFSSAGGGERRPTKLPGWSDEGWKREHDRMFDDLVKQAREGARKKAEDKGKGEGDTLVEVAGGEAEGAGEDTNGSPPTPHPEGPESILEVEAGDIPQVNIAMVTPTHTTIPNPDADIISPHHPPTKQISQLDLYPQPTSLSSTSLPPPYQPQPTHEEDPYAVPPSSQNYKSPPSSSSSQPLYPYFHSSTNPNQSQSQLLPPPASYIPIAQPQPPPPPISPPQTRRGRPTGKRTRSQMERENSSGAGAGVGMGVGMEAGMGSSQGAMRID